MVKITIIQRNFDGQGNDRKRVRWVKRGQVEITIQRLSQAYNLDHTDFEIE